jgi:hypothetical protein
MAANPRPTPDAFKSGAFGDAALNELNTGVWDFVGTGTRPWQVKVKKQKS